MKNDNITVAAEKKVCAAAAMYVAILQTHHDDLSSRAGLPLKKLAGAKSN